MYYDLKKQGEKPTASSTTCELIVLISESLSDNMASYVFGFVSTVVLNVVDLAIKYALWNEPFHHCYEGVSLLALEDVYLFQ